MKNKESKNRIFYLDELRAIAILAVIFCHAGNLYPYILDNLKVATPFFVSNLGRIGVPIFLMLSGALLLNREYELTDFFKRRYSRILIPFFFWVIVTVILKISVFQNKPDEIISWCLGKGLLWYIWELFGLYLFVPVLNEFIKKYKMQGVKYFLIIWIIYLIITNFKIDIFPNLNLQYFGGFIGYMVLGYYLVHNEFKIKPKYMIIIGFLLFLSCYIINCKLSLMTGGTIKYMVITMILQGTGVFITIKYIAKCCETNPQSFISKIHNRIEHSWIGKAIVSISICSYGMYFLHYIIYRFWDLLINPQSLKLLPILFIITSILSWIIILALSKIPYIDKISGAK